MSIKTENLPDQEAIQIAKNQDQNLTIMNQEGSTSCFKRQNSAAEQEFEEPSLLFPGQIEVDRKKTDKERNGIAGEH